MLRHFISNVGYCSELCGCISGWTTSTWQEHGHGRRTWHWVWQLNFYSRIVVEYCASCYAQSVNDSWLHCFTDLQISHYLQDLITLTLIKRPCNFSRRNCAFAFTFHASMYSSSAAAAELIKSMWSHCMLDERWRLQDGPFWRSRVASKKSSDSLIVHSSVWLTI